MTVEEELLREAGDSLDMDLAKIMPAIEPVLIHLGIPAEHREGVAKFLYMEKATSYGMGMRCGLETAEKLVRRLTLSTSGPARRALEIAAKGLADLSD